MGCLSHSRYGDASLRRHDNQTQWKWTLGRGSNIGIYGSVTRRVIGSNDKYNSEKCNLQVRDSYFNGKATWWTKLQSLGEFQPFQGTRQTRLKQRSVESNLIIPLQERGTYHGTCFHNAELPLHENWNTFQDQAQNSRKRKALDSNFSLDLNLSLKTATSNDEFENSTLDGAEVASSLSLSLSSSPHSKQLGRLKDGDIGPRRNDSRGTSTLDLTL